MSVGRASGEHRIEKAFVEALNSPLLNNMEIERARRLLYIIYTCDESQVTMSELSEINCFMDDLAPNIEVLWGLYRDNTLGEDVKVTLIATDFDKSEKSDNTQLKEDKDRQLKDALYTAYYGDRIYRKNKPEVKEEPVVQEVVEVSPIIENNFEAQTYEETPEAMSKESEESPALSESVKKSFLERFLEKWDKILED
jgi:cell division protein FtsZ